MATAEEILAKAFASEAIVVDVEKRTLTIPDTLEHIGVESDDDVFKVPFILPRYYGNIDLSKFDININYLNAKGQGDVYNVVDAEFGPEVITFSWLIGRYAAAYAGDVRFNVCLKKYNTDDDTIVDQEFNTMPAAVKVNEGLETLQAVTEEHAEVINYFMKTLCEQFNALSDKVRRLELSSGGSGEGYSEIWFEDGVLIIYPGGTNNPDEPENPGYTLSFDNQSGKWLSVYRNGDTSTTHPVGVAKYPYTNTFKFTVSPVEFSFTDADGNPITLECDSNGWYTLTQNTVVVVTSASGVVGYGLTIFDGTGYSIYINGDTTNPIAVSSVIIDSPTDDIFILDKVEAFKFTEDVEVAFRKASSNVSITVNKDEDGWYILDQNTEVVVNPSTFKGYTLGIDGSSGARVCFNGDENTVVEVTPNASGGFMYTSSKVQTVKFTDCDVSKITFRDYATGASLSLSPDSNGWYTLSQNTIATIAGASSYTISGKWIFNKTVALPEDLITIESDEILAGTDYGTKLTMIAATEYEGMMYGVASGSPFYAIDADGNWTDEKYRYVDFGTTGVTVDSAVYTWFTANAVQGEYSGADDANKWKITYALSNCVSTNSAASVDKGSSYTTVITPAEGYTINDIDVFMDGVVITNDVYYDGSIIISSVTGDVTIVATASPTASVESYTITYNLTKSSCNDNQATILAGASYNNIVYPYDGHALSSVQITMGGEDVTDSVYSYDPNYTETYGAGEINIGTVTGNIVITAVSEAVSSYSLSGEWQMNKNVDVNNTISSEIQAATISSGSTTYNTIVTLILVFTTGLHYQIDGENICVAPVGDDWGVGTFSTSGYRKLNLGSDPQVVSEEFYNWFTANATKLS